MKRHALIIGVNTYKDKRITPLNAAVQDAIDMYGLLFNGLAFDQVRILLQEQATQAEVLEALRELVADLGSDDLFLLYFAGHGFSDSRGDQMLLLKNADCVAAERGLGDLVSLELLDGETDHIPSLFILDCCRVPLEVRRTINPAKFDDVATGDIARRANSRAAVSNNSQPMAVLFASDQYQQEQEPAGQGLFTAVVADVLRGFISRNEAIQLGPDQNLQQQLDQRLQQKLLQCGIEAQQHSCVEPKQLNHSFSLFEPTNNYLEQVHTLEQQLQSLQAELASTQSANAELCVTLDSANAQLQKAEMTAEQLAEVEEQLQATLQLLDESQAKAAVVIASNTEQRQENAELKQQLENLSAQSPKRRAIWPYWVLIVGLVSVTGYFYPL